jgi:kynurenine formamidase
MELLSNARDTTRPVPEELLASVRRAHRRAPVVHPRSDQSGRSKQAMRIIDLSISIREDEHDPNLRPTEVWTHEAGGARIGTFLEPLMVELREKLAASGELHHHAAEHIGAGAFPDGLFLGNEFLSLSVHAGTHIDAPFHYGPICEGRPARRINEIPLEWCVGDGVLLRFRDKGAGDLIEQADIEAELARIGYQIKPWDIVLIETGSDQLYGSPAYFTDHPGMTVDATRFLVERGVKVIGIDCNGFDPPAGAMVERYLRTGDPTNLWGCHMYGREHEYLQIESLAGLDQLPRQYGFRVACAPIKITDAGAAWIRAFAMLED